MKLAREYVGLFVTGAVLGLVAVVALATAQVVAIAGPAFLAGLIAFGVPCFGFGILTMYAYVSSLGWERRGYPLTSTRERDA